MKKLLRTIIYTYIILFSSNYVYAQCVLNTTTTDWRQYNNGAGPSTNNFNWTTPGLVYPIYLQDNMDNPTRNVELPYFCTQPGGTGSCGNKNTLAYELLGNTAAQQDINPDDGWELVLKNFGTQNATPNDNTGRGVANPFFILYNRFTGRMKTFLAVTGVRTGSSAVLRIEFDQGNKYTALFSHAEPMTKTFDKFDNTNKFNSINEIAQKNFQDDYYWLVSEVQTAYDPCACQRPSGSTLPSVVVVTPIVITSSDIEANIEGTLEQKLIDNGSVTGETDKKTSFNQLAEKAITGYTTWDSYKTKANTYLNDYNQKYKDKLINDWWNENVKKDPSLAGVFTTAQQQQFFNDFKSSDDNFKKMVGISKIDKYNNTVNTLKGVASFLPYVGTAIGIIDFLSQGGKKEDVKPAPPMIFNASFKLSGSITTEQKLTNFAFHNPGTRIPSSPSGGHLTPIYDNVLGVFNILKEPTFQHFKIEPDVAPFNFALHDGNRLPENYPEWDLRDALAAPLKQYRITEDIKYMVNPAANLEVEVIDACYVFEYSGNDKLFIKDPNDYDGSKAIPYYHDFFKDDSQISVDDRLKSLEKDGFNLEYISTNYPSGGADASIKFRTQYVPLKCLPNLNFVLFGKALPKVYIKLLVKMKRTDNPNAAIVTQVITYDVASSFGASAEQTTTIKYNSFLNVGTAVFGYYPSLYFDYYDVTYHHFDVPSLPLTNPYYAFQNVTYTQSMGSITATGDVTIPDNTVVPDGTIIKAFGKIIIGQNVTLGNNVQLISGATIQIPANMVLHPTVIIKTDPVIGLTAFNCTSSDVLSLKASQTEINSICNSTSYLQNSGQQKTDPNQFILPEQKNTIIECTFYPNPTSSMLYASLNLDAATEYTIEITDVTGRQLLKTDRAGKEGKNIEPINVSELPAGMYFVKLDAANFSKTDKFIIIK